MLIWLLDSVTRLSLGAGTSPAELVEALSDLQGCFRLARLEIRTPRMGLSDSSQAIRALAGAVIHMSLLTHLSIPEDFVTEDLLLHISLLPRLEILVVSSTPLTHVLLGGECQGFPSLRSLDVPGESLLRRFLSYPIQDLETLRVRDLDQNTLPVVARKLPNLRQLSLEGRSFTSPEIFVLGACFQLEEVNITTQYPMGMDDLDIHRFRAMFQNLRSLTTTTRDPLSGVEVHYTRYRRDVAEASWAVEANGLGRGT